MRLHIRGHHVRLTDEIRQHAERRIRFALARFGPRLGRVVLRLADTNGPRGGDDKACLIEAHLHPHGLVLVEDRGPDLFTVIARGADRVGHTVSRLLDRVPHAQADRTVAPETTR